MTAPEYTNYSHYGEFLTAIQANPDEGTVRCAFADWVEEQGDEEEALAIREGRSFRVDVLPKAIKFVESLRATLELRSLPWLTLFEPVLTRFRDAAASLSQALNTDAGRELLAGISTPEEAKSMKAKKRTGQAKK